MNSRYGQVTPRDFKLGIEQLNRLVMRKTQTFVWYRNDVSRRFSSIAELDQFWNEHVILEIV